MKDSVVYEYWFLDQLIDQTIDNLCRVIPNYAEISKNVFAAKKIHNTLKPLKIQQNQAFTEVLATWWKFYLYATAGSEHKPWNADIFL